MKKCILIALFSTILIFENIFCSIAAPDGINLEQVPTDDSKNILYGNNTIIEENDLEMQDSKNEENNIVDTMNTIAIPEISEDVKNSATEVNVPIYNYDIDNVLIPTTYAISLNPYKLPIALGNGLISTDQVVSWKYGIVNKSTTDKIVTVTLIVEDLNNQITFVDSAEAAENADENTYAVYLTVVPADEKGITNAGAKISQNISSSELSNIEMTGATDNAVVLHAGENQIAFKLSKAIYNFDSTLIPLGEEKPSDSAQELLKLIDLNPDGNSATAFTFSGIMNSNATWSKLANGIKITAIYEYKTATNEKEILAGTHTMISIN